MFSGMLGVNQEGTMNEANTCQVYVLLKLKFADWEELSALLSSVLGRAFKGEL